MRVRIIPEYPEVVISEDGQVQGPGRWGNPVWLRPSPDGNGYLAAVVMSGGRRRSVKIATMVCTAFHGLPPTKRHMVAHCNGVNTDNRAQNLRWATKAENEADKILHGTHNRGSRHGMTKLSDDQVREIRSIPASENVPGVELARRYGVSPSAIYGIQKGRSWKYLK